MVLEPFYSIHIDFEDGGNPVVYYAMKLTDAADILKEWCVHWILVADERAYLDGIWYFHARPREDNGMSWPEMRESVIRELRERRFDRDHKAIGTVSSGTDFTMV